MNLGSELWRGLAVPTSAVVLLTSLLLGISCAEEEDDCSPGTEACPCVDGSECLVGLVCLSGHCVDPNWEPPVGGDPTVAGDGSGGGDPTAGPSVDNVGACNAFIDELECGDFDLSSLIDCGTFATYTCDLTDYFDCLRDGITCVDGIPDTSGIVECTSLSACP